MFLPIVACMDIAVNSSGCIFHELTKNAQKKLYFIKNINFVASIRNINRYGTYLAEYNNILTHIYI